MQYRALAKAEHRVIFGGRLAEYKYYDMAPIVENVMRLFYNHLEDDNKNMSKNDSVDGSILLKSK